MKATTAWSFLVCFSCFSMAFGAQPWDSAFSSDTAAILSSASQLSTPADQDVQMLLEEHKVSAAADGRVRASVRKVYRILKEDAVDDWASVEETYQPWREGKPEIRARVITKSGSVHLLDSKTVVDSPVQGIDSGTYSDARVARAPLPAVAVGSIIEFEIDTDSGPAFGAAGVTRRVQVVDTIPIQRFHLVIDGAEGSNLQMASRQILEPACKRASSIGTVHIECEIGPIVPRKNFESHLPPDGTTFPFIAYSTSPGWDALASRYSDVVDQRIQSADTTSLTKQIAPGATPLETAAQLVTALHRDVRYTGVEFGEAAVVPATPAEVLQRRFGDCKDKAALLVAMLRSVGLKAYVALLKAGPGADIDPGLPGLDLFDHAIVYVDGLQPMWIDATANYTRVGLIPTADQGRFALIASKGTTTLVKIPEQTNGLDRHEYDVRFKDYGHGSITEVMQSDGASEEMLRSAYAGDNGKSALEKYVKSAFRAKRLGTFEFTGGDDLGKAVRVSVEAVETPQVTTLDDSAQVIVGVAILLSTLPYELQEAASGEQPEEAAARTNDFLFDQVGVTERVFKLHPPALFKSGPLPESKDFDLGPMKISQRYTAGSDGVVQAAFRLEISKRRISAAEYNTIIAGLRKNSAQFQERVNFVPVTAEMLAVGQTGRALDMLREDVAAHDKDASAHVRLARLLVSIGLGMAARTEAQRAAHLDPKSSAAWQALAWSWQNDTFGRLRRGDWDRAEALRALRKAVETDPDDIVAKADLAILLEFNSQGQRYAKGNDPAEAIQLYRDMLKKEANQVLEANLTAGLLYNGQFDEAAQEARKCPDAQRVFFETILQTVKQGAGPAIVSLQTQVPDPTAKAQSLANVAFALVHLRRYPDAVTFMQAANRAATIPQIGQLLDVLGRLKRSEDVLLPPSDPRSPEQQMFVLMLGTDNLSVEQLQGIMAMPIKPEEWSDLDTLRKVAFAGFGPLVDLGFTTENFLDIALSQMNLEQKGDEAHGYVLSDRSNALMPTMFVRRVDSQYKIVGSTDEFGEVGRLVLDLLSKKDIDAAQWWLDRAVPTMRPRADGWTAAAVSLWSGIAASDRGPDKIRVTAASLIGHDEGSADAIAILKDAYAKASKKTDKAEIDYALCESYEKSKQWAELAAAAKRLMTSTTYESAGFGFLMTALQNQADWAAMQTAALARTKTDKDPRDAWKYVAVADVRGGNWSGAESAIKSLEGSGGAVDAADLTAWMQIFRKQVSEQAVDSVKKMGGANAADRLYMEALMDLQLMKTEAAQDLLKQAIQNLDSISLDARGWVIYGDICDQYGLHDAAKSAWAKARAAKAANRDAQ